MDAWIIDRLKKEEPIDDRPCLRLPLYEERPDDRLVEKAESSRGVIVINISGDDDEEI